LDTKTLNNLLADHEPGHSDFQIDNFILGSPECGTTYGKYRQVLRELEGRRAGLIGLYLDREEAQINIDELEAAADEMGQRRRAIALMRARISLDNLQRGIVHTEGEFRRFYAHAVALKKILGTLTPERKRTLDLEMWQHKARCSAAMDWNIYGRLSTDTLRLAMMMPPDMRPEFLSELRDSRGMTAWLEKYVCPCPVLPKPLADKDDLRAILTERQLIESPGVG